MNIFKKIISISVVVAFLATSVVPSQAQVLSTPLPIGMVYHPTVLQGIRVDLKDPFHLEFVIDPGDADSLRTARLPLEEESSQLIKYFLAALTVPGQDLWVNLSPVEPDRIIPQAFGQTNMGHDLLAQDYLLKQLTSSLLSPENEAGKKFWEKVYEKLYEKLSSSNASIEDPASSAVKSKNNDTGSWAKISQDDSFDKVIQSFNKVWIVPAEADVYQNGSAAYITHSRLKVMLESDYFTEVTSNEKRETSTEDIRYPLPVFRYQDDIKKIIRDVILPILEKEVNEGENFAQLRQIYHAVILAKWFKENLQKSLLGSEYADRNKVSGIRSQESEVRSQGSGFSDSRSLIADSSVQDIYNQYLEAFRKGAYDVIKEDYDPFTQQVIARKYFTGGFSLNLPSLHYVQKQPADAVANAMLAEVTLGGSDVEPASVIDADAAMMAKKRTQAQDLNQMTLFGLSPTTNIPSVTKTSVLPMDEDQAKFLAEYQQLAVRLRHEIFPDASSDRILSESEIEKQWIKFSSSFSKFGQGDENEEFMDALVQAGRMLETIGLWKEDSSPAVSGVPQEFFLDRGISELKGMAMVSESMFEVLFSEEAIVRAFESSTDAAEKTDIISQWIFLNAQVAFMASGLDADISFNLAWILKKRYEETRDLQAVHLKYEEILRYIELFPSKTIYWTGLLVPGVKDLMFDFSASDGVLPTWIVPDSVKPVIARNIDAIRDGRLTVEFIRGVVGFKGREFSESFLAYNRTYNITNLAQILLIVEEHPDMFDRVYIDVDSIYKTRGYFASAVEQKDLKQEGRKPSQVDLSRNEKEAWILKNHPDFFTLVESDLAERIHRIRKKSPTIKIRGLTVRHGYHTDPVIDKKNKAQFLEILKVLGFPSEQEGFYVGFMGSMTAKARYILSKRMGHSSKRAIYIDANPESIKKKEWSALQMAHVNTDVFRYERLDAKDEFFDWRQSYEMYMLAELAGEKRHALAFALDVLTLLRQENNWQIRADLYRHFFTYAAVQQDGRLTTTLLESVSDLLWRMQNTIYDQPSDNNFDSWLRDHNAQWLKNKNDAGVVRGYFDIVTPYNSAHFAEAFESGDLKIQKIQKNYLSADTGSYEWILDEHSMYVFLEPVMKLIVEKNPDVIVLPGSGARPFAEPLSWFIKTYSEQTGTRIKTKVVNFPISVHNAKDTPYELLRWMKLLRVELPALDDEDEDLKRYLQQLDIQAILDAKDIMIVDDNVVTGQTAKDLRAIFGILNPNIESFVVGTPLVLNEFSHYAPLPVLGTFQLMASDETLNQWGVLNSSETPPITVTTQWENKKTKESRVARGEEGFRGVFSVPESFDQESDAIRDYRQRTMALMEKNWQSYQSDFMKTLNIDAWNEHWKQQTAYKPESIVVDPQQFFNQAAFELSDTIVIGKSGEPQYVLTRKRGRVVDEERLKSEFYLDAKTRDELSLPNVFVYDIKDQTTQDVMGFVVFSEEVKKQEENALLENAPLEKVLVIRRIQPVMAHDHDFNAGLILKYLPSYLSFKSQEDGLALKGLYINTDTDAGIGQLSRSHRVRRQIKQESWFFPYAELQNPVNGYRGMRVVWTPLTREQRLELQDAGQELKTMGKIQGALRKSAIDSDVFWTSKEAAIYRRIFKTVQSQLPLAKGDIQIIRSFRMFLQDIQNEQKKIFNDQGSPREEFKSRLEKLKVKLFYGQLVMAKLDELKNDSRIIKAERDVKEEARRKNRTASEHEIVSAKMTVLFRILSASGENGNIHFPVDYFRYENNRSLTLVRMRAAFDYFYDQLWPRGQPVERMNRTTMFRFGMGEIADHFKMQNGKDVFLNELLVKDGWKRSSLSKRAAMIKSETVLKKPESIAQAVADFFERGNYGTFLETKFAYHIPDASRAQELQDAVGSESFKSVLTPRTQIKLYVTEWASGKGSQKITTAVIRDKGLAVYDDKQKLIQERIRYRPYRKDVLDIQNWVTDVEANPSISEPYMFVRASEKRLKNLTTPEFLSSIFEEQLFWHVEGFDPSKIPLADGQEALMVKIIPSEQYGNVLAFYRFEMVDQKIVATDMIKAVTRDFKDVTSETSQPVVSETVNRAMLSLKIVDDKDKEELLVGIIPVINAGRQAIYEQFPDTFKTDGAQEEPGEESGEKLGEDKQQRSPLAKAEDFDHPIVKDEQGRYWILKTLESREKNDQTQEKHIRSRAKFAELVSRTISNTDVIHLLTQEDVKNLNLNIDPEESYLSLIVDERYQNFLQESDPSKALIAATITAFWLQKVDFNLLNMAFVDNVPVFIDNDGILSNAFADQNDFYAHFSKQLWGGSSTSSSLGQKTVKNRTEYERVHDSLKDGSGRELIKAYGLNLENTASIKEVIRKIKAISEDDLRLFAHNSFPEIQDKNLKKDRDELQSIYQDIEEMVTQAQDHQQRLGTHLNEWLIFATGKDYGLSSLDEDDNAMLDYSGDVSDDVKERLQEHPWSSIIFASVFSLIPTTSDVEDYNLSQKISPRSAKAMNQWANQNALARITILSPNASLVDRSVRQEISSVANRLMYTSSFSGVWNAEKTSRPINDTLYLRSIVKESFGIIKKVLQDVFDQDQSLSLQERFKLKGWMMNPKASLGLKVPDQRLREKLIQKLENAFVKNDLKFMGVKALKDAPTFYIYVQDQKMVLSAIQERIWKNQLKSLPDFTLKKVWEETLFVGRVQEDVELMNDAISRGGTSLWAGVNEPQGLDVRALRLNVTGFAAARVVFETIQDAAMMSAEDPRWAWDLLKPKYYELASETWIFDTSRQEYGLVIFDSAVNSFKRIDSRTGLPKTYEEEDSKTGQKTGKRKLMPLIPITDKKWPLLRYVPQDVVLASEIKKQHPDLLDALNRAYGIGREIHQGIKGIQNEPEIRFYNHIPSLRQFTRASLTWNLNAYLSREDYDLMRQNNRFINAVAQIKNIDEASDSQKQSLLHWSDMLRDMDAKVMQNVAAFSNDKSIFVYKILLENKHWIDSDEFFEKLTRFEEIYQEQLRPNHLPPDVVEALEHRFRSMVLTSHMLLKISSQNQKSYLLPQKPLDQEFVSLIERWLKPRDHFITLYSNNTMKEFQMNVLDALSQDSWPQLSDVSRSGARSYYDRDKDRSGLLGNFVNLENVIPEEDFPDIIAAIKEEVRNFDLSSPPKEGRHYLLSWKFTLSNPDQTQELKDALINLCKEKQWKFFRVTADSNNVYLSYNHQLRVLEKWLERVSARHEPQKFWRDTFFAGYGLEDLKFLKIGASKGAVIFWMGSETDLPKIKEQIPNVLYMGDPSKQEDPHLLMKDVLRVLTTQPITVNRAMMDQTSSNWQKILTTYQQPENWESVPKFYDEFKEGQRLYRSSDEKSGFVRTIQGVKYFIKQDYWTGLEAREDEIGTNTSRFKFIPEDVMVAYELQNEDVFLYDALEQARGMWRDLWYDVNTFSKAARRDIKRGIPFMTGQLLDPFMHYVRGYYTKRDGKLFHEKEFIKIMNRFRTISADSMDPWNQLKPWTDSLTTEQLEDFLKDASRDYKQNVNDIAAVLFLRHGYRFDDNVTLQSLQRKKLELTDANDETVTITHLWDDWPKFFQADLKENKLRAFDVADQAYGFLAYGTNDKVYFQKIDPRTGENAKGSAIVINSRMEFRCIPSDIILSYEIKEKYPNLQESLEKARNIWRKINRDLKGARDVWGEKIFQTVPFLNKDNGRSFFHWNKNHYLKQSELDVMLADNQFVNAVAQVKTIGQADSPEKETLLYWSAMMQETGVEDIKRFIGDSNDPMIAADHVLLRHAYWIDSNSSRDRLSPFETFYRAQSSQKELPSAVRKALQGRNFVSFVFGSHKLFLKTQDVEGDSDPQFLPDPKVFSSMEGLLQPLANFITVLPNDTSFPFEKSPAFWPPWKKMLKLGNSFYFDSVKPRSLYFENILGLKNVLGEKESADMIAAIAKVARALDPKMVLHHWTADPLSLQIALSNPGLDKKLVDILKNLFRQNQWTFFSVNASQGKVYVHYKDRLKILETLVEEMSSHYHLKDAWHDTLVVGYGWDDLDLLKLGASKGAVVLWIGSAEDLPQIQAQIPNVLFVEENEDPRLVTRSILKVLKEAQIKTNQAMLMAAGMLQMRKVLQKHADNPSDLGGVDFRMDEFGVKVTGDQPKFDQAALHNIKIDGLKPISITLTPLKSLNDFLGMSAAASAPILR